MQGVTDLIGRKRRYWAIFIAALIFMHFAMGTALAVDNIEDLQTELQKENVESPASSNLTLDFIKLFFVLALILGAAWFIVRLFGKKASIQQQGNWLHVVDQVILGQNRGIVLCEVGQKVYAVGVTDHNISLLFEVNNDKLLEEISTGFPEEPDPMESFMNLKDGVKKILKGSKNSNQSKSFCRLIEEQNQRLNEITLQDGSIPKILKRSDHHV